MKLNILIVAFIILAGACNTSTPEAEQSEITKKNATEKSTTPESKFEEIIEMTCLGKTYTEHDQQNYIHYKFSIKNISDKDVESIRGRIVFTNKKDVEIKSFVMAYTNPIKSHEQTIWEAETIFDQFMDNENALKSMDSKDLSCSWEPIEIVFTDGSYMDTFSD